jgi:peptide/nickel transport system permease protein
MTDIAIAPSGSRQLAVASQWQLMWWAFRRHRLAMMGLAVTLLLYVIALIPGFFAINDPYQQNGRAAYHPPRAIHFIDTDASGRAGRFRPYFHPARLTRDPVSLAAVYKPDESRKIASTSSARATSIRSSTCSREAPPARLRAIRASRCSWSAPTGSAAASGAASCRAAQISLARPRRRDPLVAHRRRDRRHLELLRRPHRLRGQRAIEFVLAIPNIPIWLALSAAMPHNWPATTQYFMITVILSLTGWAQFRSTAGSARVPSGPAACSQAPAAPNATSKPTCTIAPRCAK